MLEAENICMRSFLYETPHYAPFLALSARWPRYEITSVIRLFLCVVKKKFHLPMAICYQLYKIMMRRVYYSKLTYHTRTHICN